MRERNFHDRPICRRTETRIAILTRIRVHNSWKIVSVYQYYVKDSCSKVVTFHRLKIVPRRVVGRRPDCFLNETFLTTSLPIENQAPSWFFVIYLRNSIHRVALHISRNRPYAISFLFFIYEQNVNERFSKLFVSNFRKLKETKSSV